MVGGPIFFPSRDGVCIVRFETIALVLCVLLVRFVLVCFVNLTLVSGRGGPRLTISVRHNVLQVCVFPIFQS